MRAVHNCDIVVVYTIKPPDKIIIRVDIYRVLLFLTCLWDKIQIARQLMIPSEDTFICRLAWLSPP